MRLSSTSAFLNERLIPHFTHLIPEVQERLEQLRQHFFQ